ncbi:NrdH-redoxin [Subtercola boreus]|uniref:Glutaredoxin-like protein NrdH n=1 Tax=Subtercola boreus TaxID=120213 RepID=A0A3E0V9U7_9MICO|nr:glutaredoxin-like protein NrdH [Subtercola boreus]RFA06439.1 NrdH-redoxin [Subtercola boreus]TQL46884.1 ribonucleoside-diphosphate reductase class Ib glutaredoxin subunit [Subtercola boreus]
MGEATVVVYSKPDCPACRATYRALDSRGIRYRVIDVTESAAALEYITQELGYSQAPVVVVDDNDHWAGFRPDKIVAHTP